MNQSYTFHDQTSTVGGVPSAHNANSSNNNRSNMFMALRGNAQSNNGTAVPAMTNFHPTTIAPTAAALSAATNSTVINSLSHSSYGLVANGAVTASNNTSQRPLHHNSITSNTVASSGSVDFQPYRNTQQQSSSGHFAGNTLHAMPQTFATVSVPTEFTISGGSSSPVSFANGSNAGGAVGVGLGAAVMAGPAASSHSSPIEGGAAGGGGAQPSSALGSLLARRGGGGTANAPPLAPSSATSPPQGQFANPAHPIASVQSSARLFHQSIDDGSPNFHSIYAAQQSTNNQSAMLMGATCGSLGRTVDSAASRSSNQPTNNHHHHHQYNQQQQLPFHTGNFAGPSSSSATAPANQSFANNTSNFRLGGGPGTVGNSSSYVGVVSSGGLLSSSHATSNSAPAVALSNTSFASAAGSPGASVMIASPNPIPEALLQYSKKNRRESVSLGRSTTTFGGLAAAGETTSPNNTSLMPAHVRKHMPSGRTTPQLRVLGAPPQVAVHNPSRRGSRREAATRNSNSTSNTPVTSDLQLPSGRRPSVGTPIDSTDNSTANLERAVSTGSGGGGGGSTAHHHGQSRSSRPRGTSMTRPSPRAGSLQPRTTIFEVIGAAIEGVNSPQAAALSTPPPPGKSTSQATPTKKAATAAMSNSATPTIVVNAAQQQQQQQQGGGDAPLTATAATSKASRHHHRHASSRSTRASPVGNASFPSMPNGTATPITTQLPMPTSATSPPAPSIADTTAVASPVAAVEGEPLAATAKPPTTTSTTGMASRLGMLTSALQSNAAAAARTASALQQQEQSRQQQRQQEEAPLGAPEAVSESISANVAPAGGEGGIINVIVPSEMSNGLRADSSSHPASYTANNESVSPLTQSSTPMVGAGASASSARQAMLSMMGVSTVASTLSTTTGGQPQLKRSGSSNGGATSGGGAGGGMATANNSSSGMFPIPHPRAGSTLGAVSALALSNRRNNSVTESVTGLNPSFAISQPSATDGGGEGGSAHSRKSSDGDDAASFSTSATPSAAHQTASREGGAGGGGPSGSVSAQTAPATAAASGASGRTNTNTSSGTSTHRTSQGGAPGTAVSDDTTTLASAAGTITGTTITASGDFEPPCVASSVIAARASVLTMDTSGHSARPPVAPLQQAMVAAASTAGSITPSGSPTAPSPNIALLHGFMPTTVAVVNSSSSHHPPSPSGGHGTSTRSSNLPSVSAYTASLMGGGVGGAGILGARRPSDAPSPVSTASPVRGKIPSFMVNAHLTPMLEHAAGVNGSNTHSSGTRGSSLTTTDGPTARSPAFTAHTATMAMDDSSHKAASMVEHSGVGIGGGGIDGTTASSSARLSSHNERTSASAATLHHHGVMMPNPMGRGGGGVGSGHTSNDASSTPSPTSAHAKGLSQFVFPTMGGGGTASGRRETLPNPVEDMHAYRFPTEISPTGSVLVHSHRHDDALGAIITSDKLPATIAVVGMGSHQQIKTSAEPANANVTEGSTQLPLFQSEGRQSESANTLPPNSRPQTAPPAPMAATWASTGAESSQPSSAAHHPSSSSALPQPSTMHDGNGSSVALTGSRSPTGTSSRSPHHGNLEVSTTAPSRLHTYTVGPSDAPPPRQSSGDTAAPTAADRAHCTSSEASQTPSHAQPAEERGTSSRATSNAALATSAIGPESSGATTTIGGAGGGAAITLDSTPSALVANSGDSTTPAGSQEGAATTMTSSVVFEGGGNVLQSSGDAHHHISVLFGSTPTMQTSHDGAFTPSANSFAASSQLAGYGGGGGGNGSSPSHHNQHRRHSSSSNGLYMPIRGATMGGGAADSSHHNHHHHHHHHHHNSSPSIGHSHANTDDANAINTTGNSTAGGSSGIVNSSGYHNSGVVTTQAATSSKGSAGTSTPNAGSILPPLHHQSHGGSGALHLHSSPQQPGLRGGGGGGTPLSGNGSSPRGGGGGGGDHQETASSSFPPLNNNNASAGSSFRNSYHQHHHHHQQRGGGGAASFRGQVVTASPSAAVVPHGAGSTSSMSKDGTNSTNSNSSPPRGVHFMASNGGLAHHPHPHASASGGTNSSSAEDSSHQRQQQAQSAITSFVSGIVDMLETLHKATVLLDSEQQPQQARQLSPHVQSARRKANHGALASDQQLQLENRPQKVLGFDVAAIDTAAVPASSPVAASPYAASGGALSIQSSLSKTLGRATTGSDSVTNLLPMTVPVGSSSISGSAVTPRSDETSTQMMVSDGLVAASTVPPLSSLSKVSAAAAAPTTSDASQRLDGMVDTPRLTRMQRWLADRAAAKQRGTAGPYADTAPPSVILGTTTATINKDGVLSEGSPFTASRRSRDSGTGGSGLSAGLPPPARSPRSQQFHLHGGSSTHSSTRPTMGSSGNGGGGGNSLMTANMSFANSEAPSINPDRYAQSVYSGTSTYMGSYAAGDSFASAGGAMYSPRAGAGGVIPPLRGRHMSLMGGGSSTTAPLQPVTTLHGGSRGSGDTHDELSMRRHHHSTHFAPTPKLGAGRGAVYMALRCNMELHTQGLREERRRASEEAIGNTNNNNKATVVTSPNEASSSAGTGLLSSDGPTQEGAFGQSATVVGVPNNSGAVVETPTLPTTTTAAAVSNNTFVDPVVVCEGGAPLVVSGSHMLPHALNPNASQSQTTNASHRLSGAGVSYTDMESNISPRDQALPAPLLGSGKMSTTSEQSAGAPPPSSSYNAIRGAGGPIPIGHNSSNNTTTTPTTAMMSNGIAAGPTSGVAGAGGSLNTTAAVANSPSTRLHSSGHSYNSSLTETVWNIPSGRVSHQGDLNTTRTSTTTTRSKGHAGQSKGAGTTTSEAGDSTPNLLYNASMSPIGAGSTSSRPPVASSSPRQFLKNGSNGTDPRGSPAERFLAGRPLPSDIKHTTTTSFASGAGSSPSQRKNSNSSFGDASVRDSTAGAGSTTPTWRPPIAAPLGGDQRSGLKTSNASLTTAFNNSSKTATTTNTQSTLGTDTLRTTLLANGNGFSSNSDVTSGCNENGGSLRSDERDQAASREVTCLAEITDSCAGGGVERGSIDGASSSVIGLAGVHKVSLPQLEPVGGSLIAGSSINTTPTVDSSALFGGSASLAAGIQRNPLLLSGNSSSGYNRPADSAPAGVLGGGEATRGESAPPPPAPLATAVPSAAEDGSKEDTPDSPPAPTSVAFTARGSVVDATPRPLSLAERLKARLVEGEGTTPNRPNPEAVSAALPFHVAPSTSTAVPNAAPAVAKLSLAERLKARQDQERASLAENGNGRHPSEEGAPPPRSSSTNAAGSASKAPHQRPMPHFASVQSMSNGDGRSSVLSDGSLAAKAVLSEDGGGSRKGDSFLRMDSRSKEDNNNNTTMGSVGAATHSTRTAENTPTLAAANAAGAHRSTPNGPSARHAAPNVESPDANVDSGPNSSLLRAQRSSTNRSPGLADLAPATSQQTSGYYSTSRRQSGSVTSGNTSFNNANGVAAAAAAAALANGTSPQRRAGPSANLIPPSMNDARPLSPPSGGGPPLPSASSAARAHRAASSTRQSASSTPIEGALLMSTGGPSTYGRLGSSRMGGSTSRINSPPLECMSVHGNASTSGGGGGGGDSSMNKSSTYAHSRSRMSASASMSMSTTAQHQQRRAGGGAGGAASPTQQLLAPKNPIGSSSAVRRLGSRSSSAMLPTSPLVGASPSSPTTSNLNGTNGGRSVGFPTDGNESSAILSSSMGRGGVTVNSGDPASPLERVMKRVMSAGDASITAFPSAAKGPHTITSPVERGAAHNQFNTAQLKSPKRNMGASASLTTPPQQHRFKKVPSDAQLCANDVAVAPATGAAATVGGGGGSSPIGADRALPPLARQGSLNEAPPPPVGNTASNANNSNGSGPLVRSPMLPPSAAPLPPSHHNHHHHQHHHHHHNAGALPAPAAVHQHTDRSTSTASSALTAGTALTPATGLMPIGASPSVSPSQAPLPATHFGNTTIHLPSDGSLPPTTNTSLSNNQFSSGSSHHTVSVRAGGGSSTSGSQGNPVTVGAGSSPAAGGVASNPNSSLPPHPQQQVAQGQGSAVSRGWASTSVNPVAGHPRFQGDYSMSGSGAPTAAADGTHLQLQQQGDTADATLLGAAAALPFATAVAPPPAAVSTTVGSPVPIAVAPNANDSALSRPLPLNGSGEEQQPMSRDGQRSSSLSDRSSNPPPFMSASDNTAEHRPAHRTPPSMPTITDGGGSRVISSSSNVVAPPAATHFNNPTALAVPPTDADEEDADDAKRAGAVDFHGNQLEPSSNSAAPPTTQPPLSSSSSSSQKQQRQQQRSLVASSHHGGLPSASSNAYSLVMLNATAGPTSTRLGGAHGSGFSITGSASFSPNPLAVLSLSGSKGSPAVGSAGDDECSPISDDALPASSLGPTADSAPPPTSHRSTILSIVKGAAAHFQSTQQQQCSSSGLASDTTLNSGGPGASSSLALAVVPPLGPNAAFLQSLAHQQQHNHRRTPSFNANDNTTATTDSTADRTVDASMYSFLPTGNSSPRYFTGTLNKAPSPDTVKAAVTAAAGALACSISVEGGVPSYSPFDPLSTLPLVSSDVPPSRSAGASPMNVGGAAAPSQLPYMASHTNRNSNNSNESYNSNSTPIGAGVGVGVSGGSPHLASANGDGAATAALFTAPEGSPHRMLLNPNTTLPYGNDALNRIIDATVGGDSHSAHSAHNSNNYQTPHDHPRSQDGDGGDGDDDRVDSAGGGGPSVMTSLGIGGMSRIGSDSQLDVGAGVVDGSENAFSPSPRRTRSRSYGQSGTVGSSTFGASGAADDVLMSGGQHSKGGGVIGVLSRADSSSTSKTTFDVSTNPSATAPPQASNMSPVLNTTVGGSSTFAGMGGKNSHTIPFHRVPSHVDISKGGPYSPSIINMECAVGGNNNADISPTPAWLVENSNTSPSGGTWLQIGFTPSGGAAVHSTPPTTASTLWAAGTTPNLISTIVGVGGQLTASGMFSRVAPPPSVPTTTVHPPPPAPPSSSARRLPPVSAEKLEAFKDMLDYLDTDVIPKAYSASQGVRAAAEQEVASLNMKFFIPIESVCDMRLLSKPLSTASLSEHDRLSTGGANPNASTSARISQLVQQQQQQRASAAASAGGGGGGGANSRRNSGEVTDLFGTTFASLPSADHLNPSHNNGVAAGSRSRPGSAIQSPKGPGVSNDAPPLPLANTSTGLLGRFSRPSSPPTVMNSPNTPALGRPPMAPSGAHSNIGSPLGAAENLGPLARHPSMASSRGAASNVSPAPSSHRNQQKDKDAAVELANPQYDWSVLTLKKGGRNIKVALDTVHEYTVLAGEALKVLSGEASALL